MKPTTKPSKGAVTPESIAASAKFAASPLGQLEEELAGIKSGDDPHGNVRSNVLQRHFSKVASRLSVAETSLGKLNVELSDLCAENQRLTDEIAALRCTDAQVMIGELKGRAEKAEKLLSLLEGAAGVRGISVENVVAAQSQPVGDDRAQLVAELAQTSDPLKRGELANKLREFDARQKK